MHSGALGHSAVRTYGLCNDAAHFWVRHLSLGHQGGDVCCDVPAPGQEVRGYDRRPAACGCKLGDCRAYAWLCQLHVGNLHCLVLAIIPA